MARSKQWDNPDKRGNAIIDILLRQDYVLVRDLAEELNVSEATIRKDLTALEKQGLLRRTHGGATHVRELTHDIHLFYRTRQIKNRAEKTRIGTAAARHIQANQIIAFSGGSTTLQIARQIAPQQPFTAITNDLNIVRVLAPHDQIEIFVPGGYLRLSRDNLIGPTATTAIRDFDIDILFLTVTGLHMDRGATAGHIGHVVYLRELVARAKRCIVVADHTKFENPAQITICGWEAVDLLITDDGLKLTIAERLAEIGIALEQA